MQPYCDAFPSLRASLFKALRDGYSELNVDKNEVQTAITGSSEYQAFSASISDLVEADATLGGNVMDTLVIACEPGYADRARSKYKAHRLTVRVKSREVIGAAA